MKQWAVFLAILTLFALPIVAKADTSISLDNGNDALDPFDTPYATVLIHLVDATHATITFDALTQNGNDYLFGAESAVGVNVNATTWTLSNIVGTNSNAGFTPGPYSDGGSGNVSEFGTINQTINSFDGYTHSADLITFDLTNTSGTWASSAVVLAANTDGNFAVAHIFVTDEPADTENDALATGFAGGSIELEITPTAAVPEPATLFLLGSGFVGLGPWARRRFLGRGAS